MKSMLYLFGVILAAVFLFAAAAVSVPTQETKDDAEPKIGRAHV